MATLKFYLRKPNKQNLHPVHMCYQDRGKKFRFSTRVLVHKEKWQNNRIKASGLDDYECNEKLATCERVIKEIEKDALIVGTLFSVEEIEQKFRSRIAVTDYYRNEAILDDAGKAADSKSDFFSLFDEFIESSKSTKAKSTIYHYSTCKKVLKNFESIWGKELTFENINNNFYQRFQNYLIEDKKCLNNTVGGYIKNIKVFLNYVARLELTNVRFNFYGFKTIREDIDIIALTEAELFKLYTCENLNSQQRVARDYVCFECFTGLRFSDIGKLRNENIKGDFIILRTQKTKDNLFVPINVFALQILDKYKSKYPDRPLPPSFSNQKTNQYIKEAAKIAGIEEPIMIEKFSGSTRISITEPKYKLISTHTGRRTFITLSYEKGMQTEMIMKITGIRKWDTLKKYLKVSEKSKLLKMNEFWNLDSLATYQNTEKNANSCHI